MTIPDMPELVLWVAVSPEAAEEVTTGEGLPTTCTGQTWIAFRQNAGEAADRALWFDTVGDEAAVLVKVTFTALGVGHAVRASLLESMARAGHPESWRFHAVLPSVWNTQSGRQLATTELIPLVRRADV